MMRLHPLHLALATFAFGVLVDQCPPRSPAFADAWSIDEVKVSRHCISEASGAQTNDCRAIAWIDKRNAERHSMTISAWMDHAHSRHLASPSRPWLAGLSADMREPPGWPASVSWESRGRPAWEATLVVVRSVLNGEIDHGCVGRPPVVWGGPTPDRERLERMLSHGWERVDCGVARNWFLRRTRSE